MSNPVIFLENEILYGKSYEVSGEAKPIEFGKAKTRKTGNDITIIAFSLQVEMALAAADILATEGIDAEVIDLRTIKPLDEQAIIDSVVKTNRLFASKKAGLLLVLGAASLH